MPAFNGVGSYGKLPISYALSGEGLVVDIDMRLEGGVVTCHHVEFRLRAHIHHIQSYDHLPIKPLTLQPEHFEPCWKLNQHLTHEARNRDHTKGPTAHRNPKILLTLNLP